MITVGIVIDTAAPELHDCYFEWAKELNIQLKIGQKIEQIDPTEAQGFIILADENWEVALEFYDTFRSHPTVVVSRLPVSVINSKHKIRNIWGRGKKNIRWALRLIMFDLKFGFIAPEDYGPEKWNYYEAYEPIGCGTRHYENYGVVFHGGFLQGQYKNDITRELSFILAEAWEMKIFNVEYMPDRVDSNISALIDDSMRLLAKKIPKAKLTFYVVGHSAGSLPALHLVCLLKKRFSEIEIVLLLIAPLFDLADYLVKQDKIVSEHLELCISQSELDRLVLQCKVKKTFILHGRCDDAISTTSSSKLLNLLGTNSDAMIYVDPDSSHMNITRSEVLAKDSKIYNFVKGIVRR